MLDLASACCNCKALVLVPYVIALGTLDSEVNDEVVQIGEESFKRSCRLRIECQLPLRDGLPFGQFVDRLECLGGARRYPSVVHRTIVKVPDDDFNEMARVFRRRCD